MSAFSRKSILFVIITVMVSACLPVKTPTTTTNTNTTSNKVNFAKGFPEGLEDISKGNYSSGNVKLSGGEWYFEDAMIGGTTSDTRNGEKAIRIREKGFVRMNYDLTGVREIKMAYGAYKADGDSEWELYISRDSGANWTKLGNRFQTDGSKLSFMHITVNEPNKARFEIRKVSGGSSRLNIDDISIITSATMPTTSTAKATREDNLAMGNPSNATFKDENNYLMMKPQYVVSYSRARSSANWVSWHLSTAWKGDIERTDNFKADDALPSGWYKVQNSDYVGSGFDRGHLCPSDDRDRTIADNEATFLLTNIIPQAPNNNRGAWAELEAYCRKVAEAGNELYIVAGVYGKAGIGTNGGKSFTLDNGKMVVPESIWKVIVILPNGTDDVNRINEQTRIIAVNMPNKQTMKDTKWGEYRLSVDDLEKITGYDFLSNVPTAIQKTLESRMDDGPTLKVSATRP
ncbi:DNA/RNA non-specific endonuclease [Emticicia agri]|uniref:DNA/RNA non-specific endonuclease n=1 Tax=Emticicia agri TaxID=2492393 RepID=A0A4Q5LXE1_9BACT|nr:DNA/RNA non-specific endonuclease [Emticicia agri]RYU94438.1 DNA/RNA non-specific endonuclease [Emticicia agri]